jgi:hypothetical protein
MRARDAPAIFARVDAAAWTSAIEASPPNNPGMLTAQRGNSGIEIEALQQAIAEISV